MSAGSGPWASMPSAAAAATAGSIFSASSPRPNRPFSPACGLMPQTRDPRRLDAAVAERLVAAPDHALDERRARSRSIASIRPMWVVTWMTRSFGVVSIIATSAVPGQLGEQLGVAGVAVAGERAAPPC